MARTFVPIVILALMTLHAGCVQEPTMPGNGATSNGPTTSAPAVTEQRESFQGASLPDGWVAHEGNWTVHDSKLEGEGDGRIGFSSLVNHGAGAFATYTLELNFTMLSGEHPQGAGVVLNWKDAKNYQIIRYSISEQGWNLFTLVDGTRDKQKDATVENSDAPDFGTLVQLRVTQRDGTITAYSGGMKVIEFALRPVDSKSGFVGAFCRGDTVAQFDDFHVRPSA